MAAAIDAPISEVLVKRSIGACLREDSPRLVIAGCVAGSHTLRHTLFELAEKNGVEVHLPDPKHCTDNAAMIAYAGFQHLCAGTLIPEDWYATPRWALSSAA